MTLTREAKLTEIKRNADWFVPQLARFLAQHDGEHVLLRDRTIVGFYSSASIAQDEGNTRFEDGRFSIHKVTAEIEHLGRYAYALSTG